MKKMKLNQLVSLGTSLLLGLGGALTAISLSNNNSRIASNNINEVCHFSTNSPVKLSFFAQSNDIAYLNLLIELSEYFYAQIEESFPTIASTLKNKIDEAILVRDDDNKTPEEIYDECDILSGALNTAQIEYVEALINEIGTVEYTDDCFIKILVASEEYAGLSDNLKAQISNYDTLKNALVTYVELAIDEIPTPLVATKECGDAIKAAYELYITLPEDLKNDVENKQKLFESRISYVKLAISAIPSPVVYTAECEQKITTADTAYNALNNDEQTLIDNVNVLEQAKEDYDELKANHEAAEAVIEKIDAIGVVTYPDSRQAIQEARTAYDALTTEEKACVPAEKLSILINDEHLFDELEHDHQVAEVVINKIDAIGVVKYPDSRQAIENARSAYEALSIDQKGLVPPIKLSDLINAENEFEIQKSDCQAAEHVMLKIGDIGLIEYNQECKDRIDDARNAYDALTPEQKAYVRADSLSTLINAEEAYNQLKANHEAAEAVIAKINAIGEVEFNDACRSKIQDARNSYEALTIDQKELVTNRKLLADAESRYMQLVTQNNVRVAMIVTFSVLGGLIFLVVLCYIYMFLFKYKWINIGGKAVRVHIIGKKGDKIRLLAIPFKIVYRLEKEIFDSKESVIR